MKFYFLVVGLLIGFQAEASWIVSCNVNSRSIFFKEYNGSYTNFSFNEEVDGIKFIGEGYASERDRAHIDLQVVDGSGNVAFETGADFTNNWPFWFRSQIGGKPISFECFH